ncbi:MAG: hypothetical protein Q8O15_03335, partial [Rectinemataceae bacterium]|nr:hypothetical protein [Rectinemataceae bacterium]
ALTALRYFRLLPHPFKLIVAVPRQLALRALDEGSKLAHSLSSAQFYFSVFCKDYCFLPSFAFLLRTSLHGAKSTVTI